MRRLWTLTLLLALVPGAFLPGGFQWRLGAAECCGEACCCVSDEGPSCCEREATGPVIVAPYPCGMPHGAKLLRLPALQRLSTPPTGAVAIVCPVGRISRVFETRCVGRVPTPEPPPPRRVA